MTLFSPVRDLNVIFHSKTFQDFLNYMQRLDYFFKNTQNPLKLKGHMLSASTLFVELRNFSSSPVMEAIYSDLQHGRTVDT